MDENKKHIDDIFREGLGGYTERPDNQAWSDIEKKLDGGGKPSGGFGIAPGRVLLILVAGVALFFAAKWAIGNFSKNKKDTPVVVVNENNPSTSWSQNTDEIKMVQPAETSAMEQNDEVADKSNNVVEKKAKSVEASDDAVVPPVADESKAAKRTVRRSSAFGKPKTSENTVVPPAKVKTPPIKPLLQATNKPEAEAPALTKKIATKEKQLPAAKSDIPVARPQEPLVPQGATTDPVLVDTVSNQPDLSHLKEKIRKKLKDGSVEGGIKGGIEMGFNSYSAVRIVAAPYVQYNASNNLSFVLQPTIKYSWLTRSELDKTTYYNTTNGAVTTGHTIAKGDSLSGAPDTITRRYYYNQTIDSLIIGHNLSPKQRIEFELPVMLQYKISDRLSAFAGLNFNFSKTVQVKEDRAEYKNIKLSDSVTYAAVPVTAQSPIPPSINEVFDHTASPYSSYTASKQYQNQLSDPLKIGYILGFTYKARERLSVDILVQQMLTNGSFIPNDKVRALYKQPYFRIGVGYRLFNTSK